jgi:hypothetical protein
MFDRKNLGDHLLKKNKEQQLLRSTLQNNCFNPPQSLKSIVQLLNLIHQKKKKKKEELPLYHSHPTEIS